MDVPVANRAHGHDHKVHCPPKRQIPLDQLHQARREENQRDDREAQNGALSGGFRHPPDPTETEGTDDPHDVHGAGKAEKEEGSVARHGRSRVCDDKLNIHGKDGQQVYQGEEFKGVGPSILRDVVAQ